MRFNYNSWASLLLYYLISFWLLLLPPCLSLTQFTKSWNKVILSLVSLLLYILGISKPMICTWGKSDPLVLFLCIDATLFAPNILVFFLTMLQWAFQLVLFSFLFRSISFISLSHHSDLSTHSSDFVLPSKELPRLVNDPRVKSSSLYVD